MTSIYTREDRLKSFRNAISKLSPKQIDEKILLLDLAARREFHQEKISKEVLQNLSRDEIAAITLDEFIEKVQIEVEKIPESEREQQLYFDL